MSFKITRTSSNTVDLLLKDTTTVSNPYYLFSLTSRNTNKTKNFIAPYTSTYPDRYYRFTIVESTTESLTNGQVTLSPAGFWDYKIYAQTSSSNVDPDSADELVKEGIVRVVGTAVQTYTEYSGASDEYVTYDPTA